MTPNRRAFLKSGLGFAAGGLLAGTAAARARDGLAPVDCHTHFYDPSRPQGVPWPEKGSALYKTVLPDDFLEQAAPFGVKATVAVEASPWVEDNAWLLELAAAHPAVVGVVGNLTPGGADFARHLKRFAAAPKYRGIRISHEALRRGLGRREFLADVRSLAEHGLGLDVNGGPDLPADVALLAEKAPDLRIVVNHLANVDVDGGPPPARWLAGLRAAAARPRVYCKVSALVEHAKPKGAGKAVPADVAFYRPVLDGVWDAFGDDRLVYGSNWPVSDLAAPYKTVFSIVDAYVRARSRSAAEKFFATNARAAYRLPG